MSVFNLSCRYEPKGDQPAAIERLTCGVLEGRKYQVLLGVTGSGKTLTVANVIRNVGRPTLVIAHNKTLAAQLWGELRDLFPENAVNYFVSYYDYYQPEAYIPQTDTYIEKDAQINERIERMRHASTSALFERRDVIIVASVSCIYGISSPEDYYGMLTVVDVGMDLDRDTFLAALRDVQYERTRTELRRGTFRVRGDVVDVFPSHEESRAVRVEFFGDTVDAIKEIDPVSGRVLRELERKTIFPGTHYVAPRYKMQRAICSIRRELEERLRYFERLGRELERSRLKERVEYDLELLATMGFCPGIENYSRHISGRRPGEPPWTLIDYFPRDFLLIVDESHQTIPQLRGMYHGDRSRKLTLIEHGFRLPSALDNRPLSFEEFEERINQVIFVSATPGPYELAKAGGEVVEQIIRARGLVDPEVEVKPATNQVDDLLAEIRRRVEAGERVLVTTLTKKMAEELTEYYRELGVRVEYLHSDIDTLERIRIVRDLRLGRFDVLVGINLLREGLDIPEVSLVAILDADKEGFLRSTTSLIQTFGRAARNAHGRVILYADQVTSSMAAAVAETERRRRKQVEYNRAHGITPQTIRKGVTDILADVYERDYVDFPLDEAREEQEELYCEPAKIGPTIERLTREMKKAAKELEFEKAARLRDRIKRLRELELIHLGEVR